MTQIVLPLLLLLLQTASVAPATQRRVFVIDKVSQVGTAQSYGGVTKAQEGEHHSAPVVMAEFSKKCPTVVFTTDRETADLVLATQPGATSLADRKGDVLYVSPAKTLKNMTKDICGYISAH